MSKEPSLKAQNPSQLTLQFFTIIGAFLGTQETIHVGPEEPVVFQNLVQVDIVVFGGVFVVRATVSDATECNEEQKHHKLHLSTKLLNAPVEDVLPKLTV